MTLDLAGGVNWIAVLVAALLYYGLGALWYSPMLFARPWMRSIGWDPGGGPPGGGPLTYLRPAPAYLVMAVAIALLAAATGSDTLSEGIVLGLVAGVGLALMHTFVDASFDPNKPEPWVWFAINGGYHAVGLLIVAVVVSVWR